MSKDIKLEADKWYSTTDVVKLGQKGYFPFKSISSVYNLIYSGELPVVRKGDENKWSFSIHGKDLIALAESQKISLANKKKYVKQVQKNSTTAKK